MADQRHPLIELLDSIVNFVGLAVDLIAGILQLDQELLHVHRHRPLGELLREHRVVTEIAPDAEADGDDDRRQHEDKFPVAAFRPFFRQLDVFDRIEQTLRH